MAVANVSLEETKISSEDPTRILFCQPCQGEGKQLSAVVYCVECREYLCQRCYECHLVPTLTKNHKLNMIKENIAESEVMKDEEKLGCPEHMDEEIKYHCETHSLLGCHICAYKHQKTCKEVVYIPEVFDNINNSEDLIKIIKRVDNITNKCTELASNIQHEKELVGLNHTEAITAMKKFKRESLDLIDNLERDITHKANIIKTEEYSNLDLISKECQIMLVESKKIATKIEMQQEQDKKIGLYVIIQQYRDILLKMEASIQGYRCRKQRNRIAFKANIGLSDTLKSRFGLGVLQMKGTIEKVEFKRDIDIRSSNDINICMCRGFAVLPGNKLIISDCNNFSVKLFNTKQNKIISALKLSSNTYSVWGVCAISETAVAVTLKKDDTIVLVRTDPVLKVERELKVNGSPCGIGYHDDKIVVSYSSSPNRVEIMDMQGKVISTFAKDSDGRELFEEPVHIAINPNNNLIYVSDHKGHNVMGMKFDGSVVGIYSGNEMEHPMQVAFDCCNNVYVCCFSSHNVHRITEDCKHDRLVLTTNDKLMNPSSIWYNESEGEMYIGQESYLIKVYQLTYSNA